MGLTRGVNATLLTALAGHFHPVLLIEADHPDGMVRAHSGIGTITWAAKSWLGGGRYVQFAGPEEATGLATADASIRIAATVDAMFVERGKAIRNRSLSIWFGATTEPSGTTLVGVPCLLFAGYFDSRTFSLRRQGDDFAHDMVLGLGIGPGARANASITHGYEDQIAAYPGDTAGRHVQRMLKQAVNPPRWPAP